MDKTSNCAVVLVENDKILAHLKYSLIFAEICDPKGDDICLLEEMAINTEIDHTRCTWNGGLMTTEGWEQKKEKIIYHEFVQMEIPIQEIQRESWEHN